MKDISYESGVALFGDWGPNVQENMEDYATAMLSVGGYSSHTVKGTADPDDPAPSASAGDCYICTGSGTIFGVGGCYEYTILYYNGASWEQLPDKFNELDGTGDQGPQGETGSQGPQGLRGYQGMIGPQGDQGYQGPTGVQGPAGETGPQGTQGVQGETGEQGPQGYQGYQGEEGEQGVQGVVGGSMAWEGAWSSGHGTYYIDNGVENDSSSYLCIAEHTASLDKEPGVGASWETYWDLSAQKGEQGSQGTQGETGPQGTQGETGEQGPQGTQGETGDTGPQGETGEQGPTGSQGPQGVIGSTGPQGDQGHQGETGETGPQGYQGEQGEQGETGETGPQGYQGEQGEQGEIGEVTQADLDNALDDLQDYVDNLTNLYMGVTIPTNGSQSCTRTGNPEWGVDMPFLEDIAVVLLADDLTENEVLATPDSPEIPSGADLTGASGQVMVRFRKFYYREIFDGSGNLSELRWSNQKLPGFEVHPFFTKGGLEECEYTYISAYEAGYDGSSKLISASGVAPLTDVDLATFRTRAEARGTNWHGYDHWAQHLIQFYFYLYYASLDSQGQLPGYTEASSYEASYKRDTGRTDGLTTMNGSVDVDLTGTDSDLDGIVSSGDKIANRFLFIENIFGHIWKMMDGVSFDGRVGEDNTVWLSKNPADYSSVEADILADYEDLGLDLWAGTTSYIETVHQGFIPKNIGGGSSTYFGDRFYSYLDDSGKDYLRLVRAGGSLIYGVIAGVGSRTSNLGLSYASLAFGSRLCAKNFS